MILDRTSWGAYLVQGCAEFDSFLQAFLVDFVDDDRFMSSRRKLLRQRAGLTNKDTHKVSTSDLSAPLNIN